MLMSSFQFQYDHVNVILMSNMKQWLLNLKLNFDNGAIDRRRLIRTFSACYLSYCVNSEGAASKRACVG